MLAPWKRPIVVSMSHPMPIITGTTRPSKTDTFPISGISKTCTAHTKRLSSSGDAALTTKGAAEGEKGYKDSHDVGTHRRRAYLCSHALPSCQPKGNTSSSGVTSHAYEYLIHAHAAAPSDAAQRRAATHGKRGLLTGAADSSMTGYGSGCRVGAQGGGVAVGMDCGRTRRFLGVVRDKWHVGGGVVLAVVGVLAVLRLSTYVRSIPRPVWVVCGCVAVAVIVRLCVSSQVTAFLTLGFLACFGGMLVLMVAPDSFEPGSFGRTATYAAGVLSVVGGVALVTLGFGKGVRSWPKPRKGEDNSSRPPGPAA